MHVLLNIFWKAKSRVPTLVSVTGMKVHVQTYCLCVSITVDSHRLDLHLTAASHYLHTGRAGELDIRQLDRWSLLLTLGFLQQEILSHDIATSQKSENSWFRKCWTSSIILIGPLTSLMPISPMLPQTSLYYIRMLIFHSTSLGASSMHTGYTLPAYHSFLCPQSPPIGCQLEWNCRQVFQANRGGGSYV